MEVKPLISVIMPARIDTPEKAKWMTSAIKSVQWQTFREWELVIVDDHSTIEPMPWAWGDNRIRLVQAMGQGVAQARNQAVRLARGDAIYPLDSDDLIDERTLQVLYDEWKKDKGWLVYTGTLLFGNGLPSTIVPVHEYDFDVLLTRNLFNVGALFSRRAWEKVGGWKDALDGVEDWEFWVALGEAGVCGLLIDKPFYWYRKHDTGLTVQTTPGKIARLSALHKESKKMSGCCGSGRRATPVHQQSVQPMQDIQQAFPGEEGMDVMEYTGTNHGIQEWRGMSTNARYAFGGTKRRGYVDKRDVPSLIARGVFRVVPEEEAMPASVPLEAPA